MDATNYGHLQRLGVLMNILSPGKQYWSVVEWRCKLKAVRGPAASRFDYDGWDSWLRAQAEVDGSGRSGWQRSGRSRHYWMQCAWDGWRSSPPK